MGDCGLNYALCDGGQETLQHLLFECENVKQVRKRSLQYPRTYLAGTIVQGGNQAYGKD